jgi:hypothetical protein
MTERQEWLNVAWRRGRHMFGEAPTCGWEWVAWGAGATWRVVQSVRAGARQVVQVMDRPRWWIYIYIYIYIYRYIYIYICQIYSSPRMIDQGSITWTTRRAASSACAPAIEPSPLATVSWAASPLARAEPVIYHEPSHITWTDLMFT